MKNNEYDIYKIIEMVQRRPGIYIGVPSTISMSIYLGGYQQAMRDTGVEDVSSPDFYEFHNWVQKKLGYLESNAGWSNMILANTLGLSPNHLWNTSFKLDACEEQHDKALKQFFEFIDEYRSKGKNSSE
jgi:hypothetical protein